MDLFASDLDNTLIYSYKRDIGTDTVCAEVYEGRQVSFMTKWSRELLEKVNQTMHFVPVTTRSVQQYQRIRFGDTWSPRLALAANGGVLLRDGVSDPDWYRASCDLIAPAEPAMQQAEDVLEHDPNRTLDVRRVDGLFVFTKSADVPHTLARLRDALDLTHVELFENGVKVYVVPRVLNKGTGVRRLRERFPEARVFAAGDSLFDLPLLAAADTAFCPDALDYTAQPGQTVVTVSPQDGIFSDVVLGRLAANIDG